MVTCCHLLVKIGNYKHDNPVGKLENQYLFYLKMGYFVFLGLDYIIFKVNVNFHSTCSFYFNIVH